MSAVMLWECRDCGQPLLRPWLPCDCPGLSGDRFLITPLGAIPAEQLGAGPLEPEQVAA
jgi:hypothetical protein